MMTNFFFFSFSPLLFQAPCDNGSKIQSFILEWDEVSTLIPFSG